MNRLKKLLRRLLKLAKREKEIPLEKHRNEFLKCFKDFIDLTMRDTDEEG